MIEKGEYKILQNLNISKSIASQQNAEYCPNSESIFKCLVEKEHKNYVFYFVGEFNLGQNSIIEIVKENAVSSLIYKTDYKIVLQKPYIHDVEFLKELQKKKV